MSKSIRDSNASNYFLFHDERSPLPNNELFQIREVWADNLEEESEGEPIARASTDAKAAAGPNVGGVKEKLQDQTALSMALRHLTPFPLIRSQHPNRPSSIAEMSVSFTSSSSMASA